MQNSKTDMLKSIKHGIDRSSRLFKELRGQNANALTTFLTLAVVQWIRALVQQAEGSFFESQPRQT